MKTVRFLRTCLPYVAGDIAGFDDNQARDLVSRGVAVLHERNPQPQKRDAPPEMNRMAPSPRRKKAGE